MFAFFPLYLSFPLCSADGIWVDGHHVDGPPSPLPPPPFDKDGDAISVSLRIEDSGSGLPLDFPAAIRCDHPDPLVFCGLPSFVRFYPEDELRFALLLWWWW